MAILLVHRFGSSRGIASVEKGALKMAKNTIHRAKAPKAKPAPLSKNPVVAKKPVPAKRVSVVRKTLPAPENGSPLPATVNRAVAVITDIHETLLPPPVLVLAPAVTYEQIAIRAYEIYRARTDARPEDDWLRAERELKGL